MLPVRYSDGSFALCKISYGKLNKITAYYDKNGRLKDAEYRFGYTDFRSLPKNWTKVREYLKLVGLIWRDRK